jgi:excinuclease ABC subunit A
VIEHNMDVVKQADWVIDLGPEGGEEGGRLVFQGTPEALAGQSEGRTCRYLREALRGAARVAASGN